MLDINDLNKILGDIIDALSQEEELNKNKAIIIAKCLKRKNKRMQRREIAMDFGDDHSIHHTFSLN